MGNQKRESIADLPTRTRILAVLGRSPAASSSRAAAAERNYLWRARGTISQAAQRATQSERSSLDR
jgi:hypothetical protein